MLLPLYFSLLRAHSSLISTNTTANTNTQHTHTCIHWIQKNSFTYRRRREYCKKICSVCAQRIESERDIDAQRTQKKRVLASATMILPFEFVIGRSISHTMLRRVKRQKKRFVSLSFALCLRRLCTTTHVCCACVSIECFKHFFVFSAQNLRLTHWYHPKCTLYSTKQPNRFNEIQRSVFVIFHWHHAHFYLFLLTFCILKIDESQWILRVFFREFHCQ